MTNRNFKLAAIALSAALGGMTPTYAQQAAPEQQTAPAQQAGANSADACQPAPKGAAPQGKHWYYHTDRKAGRKCWYLGEAGMKTTTRRVAAQPKAATDSKPASQQDLDARAEVPPQPAAKSSSAKSSTAPEAATDTATETSEPATTQATPDGIASARLLTQRWPEADAFRPSQTTGAATPLANSQPTNLQPAASQAQAASSPSAAAPSPSVQPAAATPTDATPSDQPASLSSWRTILGALLVALGFAGLLGFVTFRYFGRQSSATRRMPSPRRDIWGDRDEETGSLSPSYDQMIAPSRWASTARASLAPQDLDEIEQLLRRAALEPHPAANTNSRADPAARARTPIAPSAARASTAQRAGSFRPR